MIGMCTTTLFADRAGAGEREVKAVGEAVLAAGCTEVAAAARHCEWLAAVGLRIRAVEGARCWANHDDAVAAEEVARLVAVAAAHGAERLVAVTLEPEVVDLGRARARLARLAEAAAGAGVQVCVEFLPWTGIPDLASAWSLVEPLDDSAGILLDTWHWVRQPLGPAPEVLATIPGRRIGFVQVCDAGPTPGPDPMLEAMTARLLPGEGIVDFPAVMAQLHAIGATPFVATEIYNPALVERLGVRAAAVAMVESAERALAAG
jgi:sugar phosphate isomerase/epimerase